MQQKGRSSDYLSTTIAAEYCSVTVRTIINWIKRGELNAHQLPGTRGDNRIAKLDLVEFMERNQLPIPRALAGAGLQQKALIVDDDAAMARSIARQLRSLKYETVLAHNGFEAGIAYVSERPSLITLDLQMPRADGFEVLHGLRDRDNCRVVVISGMGPDALDKALDLGADAVLPKPFDEDELLLAIGHEAAAPTT